MWCHLQMWNAVYLCILFHHISSWWCSFRFLSLHRTISYKKLQKWNVMKWNACNVMRCEVGRCEGDNSEDPVLQECTYFDDISIFQNTHHHLCTYSEAEGKEALKTLPSTDDDDECQLLPPEEVDSSTDFSLSISLEFCCFFTLFFDSLAPMWSTQPPPMILSHFLELREICEAGLWTAFLLSQKLAKSLLPEEFWRLGWWHDNIIQLLSAVRS